MSFRKVAGFTRRLVGGSSSAPRRSERLRFSEPQETIHDEEEEEEEEEGEPNEELVALGLVDEREVQAYLLLKDRDFLHAPSFDPSLLHKIGMDVEFKTVLQAIGWRKIDPIWEEGSRFLTIQFLCTLRNDNDGISFRLFGQEYELSWKELAKILGFAQKCAVDIDVVL